jgi:hypothetical protein
MAAAAGDMVARSRIRARGNIVVSDPESGGGNESVSARSAGQLFFLEITSGTRQLSTRPGRGGGHSALIEFELSDSAQNSTDQNLRKRRQRESRNGAGAG